ncbi:hypothetical protein [Reticulibacter mediterranei]|uniref:hypothetical protein n=1 Tax=Reticulibacter mediterranei TaxID=2778369 RepID=UPI001C6894D4|nr:hypothetical protein [Reticulibacter mediterranei]
MASKDNAARENPFPRRRAFPRVPALLSRGTPRPSAGIRHPAGHNGQTYPVGQNHFDFYPVDEKAEGPLPLG